MEDIKLSQLVSSKLCHDLIAPVGAINSGLELLEEVDDKAEVMSLIAQSAQSVARRLTYFRTSFGASASNDFSSLADIKKFISDFIGPHNINLVWNENYAIKDTASWGRLISNIVLTLIDIAPYGGTLSIQFNTPNTSSSDASFKIVGNILTLREELVQVLEGKVGIDQITPKTIQAYLTYRFAESMNLALRIVQSAQGEVKINVLNASASKSVAV